MSYTPIPITERTQKIKEQYMRLAVPLAKDVHANKRFRQFHTGDKWITLGFLEGWARHADAPSTKLRRAYAEAEELYAARPIILDGELMAGHLYLPEYTKEEQARYDALCERFEMSAFALSNGAKTPSETHIALDLEKLLRLGLNGLRREITEHRNALDLNASHAYPDFEEFERDEFYRACLLELDALSDLARRYADAAEQQAASADGTRRSELLRISHTLRRVPDAPAESFFEAIQSVHFFLSNLFGLYPLGRPDRYLYPFYKRDVEGGALTREEAQELIDQFCLGISDRVFTRAACGFIVGGRDASGVLVENALTYMFLTALDHLRLPDPNGALAVTAET
jgi:pyruvate-formate lyase